MSVANSIFFLWIFSFCIPGQSLVISTDFKHNVLHLYVYMCPNPSRYCIIVVLWKREKAIFFIEMVYNVCVSLRVLIPSVM